MDYFNVNEKRYFRHHGIRVDWKKTELDLQKPSYVHARLMGYGVFPALLLRFISVDDLNYYLLEGSCISLNDLNNIYFIDHHHFGQYPARTFIGSWILSTIVRYHPTVWQKLLRGEGDDIINRIRDFRRNNIPGAIRKFLENYYDEDSYDSSW